jgi:AcrR family transcriptional regulator
MKALQPAERRRLQSRTEARRAILDATESLLVEDGFEAFSMRRLAERCGYTPPTIYHHFVDKQHLLDELLEERCRALVKSLKRAGQGDDPVEKLRAFGIAFARWGLRNPTHYTLLAQSREPELPVPPAAEEARALMEGPLEKIAAEGRLTADIETTGQAIWAFLHGFVLLRSSRSDIAWMPDVLEVGFAALLHSFIRDADRTPAREETRQ